MAIEKFSGDDVGELSQAISSLSELEPAKQLLEEGLAFSSTLDDKAYTADIGLMLFFLVWVTRLQGQPARARELLQQSMETCHKANYQMGIQLCTGMRGEIEYDAGNYSTACQYYKQMLILSENAQFIMGTLYMLAELGNTYAALAEYLTAADYLRRGLILNRDLLSVPPLLIQLLGIATMFGRQGQHAMALELLVIILNHPQCGIAAQHKGRIIVSELGYHLTGDEIKTVMDKANRGQLSNRYVEPNFRVDTEFVDRLLEMIDQAF